MRRTAPSFDFSHFRAAFLSNTICACSSQLQAHTRRAMIQLKLSQQPAAYARRWAMRRSPAAEEAWGAGAAAAVALGNCQSVKPVPRHLLGVMALPAVGARASLVEGEHLKRHARSTAAPQRALERGKAGHGCQTPERRDTPDQTQRPCGVPRCNRRLPRTNGCPFYNQAATYLDHASRAWWAEKETSSQS